MAKLPKVIKVEVSVDTFKVKMITAEQIAHAYGVPPELMGLLPPDAGETIAQAAFDGTLTGEAFLAKDDQGIHAWEDTGKVLAPGECPANGSPYVPGQLGINSMLVHQHAPSPSTWEGKTTTEIMADIQKAADHFGKKTMPKKTFKAPEPGKGSGIPAHAVFTSPLIHDVDSLKEKAQKLLKATGDVKVQQLDEQGQPTGKLVTLGQVQDFNLGSIAENVQVSENDYGVSFVGKLLDHTMALDFNASPLTDHMHWTGEGLHAQAHVWCAWHRAHVADPVHAPLAGKVWQCGSSAWTRPSTPLEDKQVLAKIRMMHDTGLL